MAAAIEDDVAVPQLITGGRPDADTPVLREPTAGVSDLDEVDTMQDDTMQVDTSQDGTSQVGTDQAG